MKRAVLNMADTGATESTTIMLVKAGYEVRLPEPGVLKTLRDGGLEHVLDVDDMVRDWGYARPNVPRTASMSWIRSADLFVDVKAHVNAPRIENLFPSLRGKVLWCCLNGGDPLKRKDGLPWADPPCPVLTHNMWYQGRDRSYVCFPPYARKHLCSRGVGRKQPICLTHNVGGWGYGHLIPKAKSLGVRFFGGGSGNDELIPHERALELLSAALCLVHLKQGDTVGYATVEAIHSGCPIVCSKHYISECHLETLFEPGVTCITFDHTSEQSLADAIMTCEDPDHMWMIADNARRRWDSLEWRDEAGFAEFLRRNFP